MRTALFAGLLALGFPLSAVAQDRLLDLSTPPAIVAVLQEEGYKAVLKTDEDGAPYIESAANGSSFTIQFFGCDAAKACTSAQFFTWYRKEPWFSTDVANRWNAGKRFVKIAIDKDGDFSVYMDVSLTGKLTYANFADTIDWWAVMTADLGKFIDVEEEKANPVAPAPAKTP
jgi:hypothetical protein